MGSDRALYGEDEGLTPGSSIVEDVRKKARAKKRLLDAIATEGVKNSAAGVQALPGGMNMNQRKMLKEIE